MKNKNQYISTYARLFATKMEDRVQKMLEIGAVNL